MSKEKDSLQNPNETMINILKWLKLLGFDKLKNIYRKFQR